MKIHKSVTQERVLEAAERQMVGLDNPGICIACGNEQEGCEPDARNYVCEACDAKQVFGASELMFMIDGMFETEEIDDDS